MLSIKVFENSFILYNKSVKNNFNGVLGLMAAAYAS